MNLKIFKTHFDPLFLNYIEQKLDSLFAMPHRVGFFISEQEHLLVLARSGKRIRAYVAFLSARSHKHFCGEDFYPLLFALELFHLFALIHDDIIDGSPTRRGIKSFHALFGENQAILWGDLVLTLAHKALQDAFLSRETETLFSQMAEETIFGQMLDIAPDLDASRELTIELKTARYTFVYPILLGISASSKSLLTSDYARFGLLLGKAFQRLDDLLDKEDGEITNLFEEKKLMQDELVEARKVLSKLEIKKEYHDEWYVLIETIFNRT
jgi:geranylgeranyl pyrophosphate synthase